MKAVALAFGVAGVTLFGCGSGGGPSPTPGYNPTSVADAWANHFAAFGAGDAVKIMLDYDDESVLAVFNDACNITTGEYAEYKGQEIKGFFESLFTRLGSPQDATGTLNVPAFSADGTITNPVVEPTTGPVDATANVFLVWSSVGEGVGPTTDSFMWKAGYKIMKQNIVTTEASQCTTGAARVAQKRTERRLKDSAKIEAAWTNHLDSFGAQNLTSIMYDYLDTSIIRVFDFNGVQYSAHTGLTEIRTMFEGLFVAINAAKVDDLTGVDVRQLEVEAVYNSVFLVWKSFSHPKATDTFLFDDEGKIVRQNIVVTTKSSASAQAWV